MNANARTARITQLRESIARRALTDIGAPATTRILDTRHTGNVIIVASEDPTNRWSRYYIETFRAPNANDIDPRRGDTPKHLIPIAGWSTDSADDIDGLLAKAIAYATTA
ncbi:hypothetical protein AB0N77_09760 [Streptomyces misionensis]|uniref:hypothetical protein n=1 Tax=Streptomyces misionensis TaxID=67331 RepID=UPI0034421553